MTSKENPPQSFCSTGHAGVSLCDEKQVNREKGVSLIWAIFVNINLRLSMFTERKTCPAVIMKCASTIQQVLLLGWELETCFALRLPPCTNPGFPQI